MFYYIVKYLAFALPSLFILENVENLIKKHKEWFTSVVLPSLKALGNSELGTDYKLFWKLRSTSDDGIPHNRPRVWVVGIRKNTFKNKFCWPKAIKMKTLTQLLGSAP